MASCRARPTPSSICRDALMEALDLPRFLIAGTVSAARRPRIEITTSISTSVKAFKIFDLRLTIAKASRPESFNSAGNRQSAIGNRQSFISLPAQNVVPVDALVCRRSDVKFPVRSGGPDHDRAVILETIQILRIAGTHQTIQIGRAHV